MRSENALLTHQNPPACLVVAPSASQLATRFLLVGQDRWIRAFHEELPDIAGALAA